MELQQQVIELIVKVVRESTGREIELGAEDRIIATGLLDSLSMVNLVVALQREFDIDVEITDLDEGTFGSAASIATFVEERRA